MLFVLLCHDRPDSEALRLQNRDSHLDYVAASGDTVKIAGPITSDDGSTMIGSLIVLDVESRAAAEGWSALDPYARAGLFERVEILPWKWLINNPED